MTFRRSPRSKHTPVRRIRHLPAGSAIRLDGRQLYLGEWDGDRALLWPSEHDYRAGEPWMINVSGCVPVPA